MFPSHRVLAVALGLTLAAVASAAENAALSKYGATITVTCGAPTPLNDRWNKPVNMLRDEKPAGPIMNEIDTGVITISFPLPMSVVRVGIRQGDYRGSFAKAKDFTVSSSRA